VAASSLLLDCLRILFIGIKPSVVLWGTYVFFYFGAASSLLPDCLRTLLGDQAIRSSFFCFGYYLSSVGYASGGVPPYLGIEFLDKLSIYTWVNAVTL